MDSSAFVSVVTPFYNTCEYLAECIESVLRQSYQNWEYILVDNFSDDGSSEIAADFASRFPSKIRLIHTDSFLSQVANYNFALTCISKASKYCKIVQADDWLYPECLERMVAVAESGDSIGIVSSYRLKGTRVLGDGLRHTQTVVAGSDLCRLQLTTPLYAFGTPTTVLYRSDIVREQSPFYDEGNFFDDSDACYRTLQSWNFGFVHQILSFSRVGDDSIRGRVIDFGPDHLDTYLQLHKFGPVFLKKQELDWNLHKAKADYYRFLAWRLLVERSSAFWKFHTSCLGSAGLRIERPLLAKHLFIELARLLFHPLATFRRIYARLRPARKAVTPECESVSKPSTRDSTARC
jgi:glycosyltransferase involved in cell wall biosynthesis